MVRARAGVVINEQLVSQTKARLELIAHKAKPHRFAIGISADAGNAVDYHGRQTTTPLAEVAAIQEFTGRSWLRTWYDTNADRLPREMLQAEQAEFQGNTGAVENLAKRWQSEVRQWIVTRQAHLKPLAQDTIAERDSAGIAQDTPLYATGQLVNEIKAYIDGREAA